MISSSWWLGGGRLLESDGQGYLEEFETTEDLATENQSHGRESDTERYCLSQGRGEIPWPFIFTL